MKKDKAFTVLFLLFHTLLCTSQTKSFVWNEHKNKIDSKPVDHGVAVFQGAKIQYKKNGKLQYNIEISDPVLVYEAEKIEGWGFVQFPRIFRAQDGRIAVMWNMSEDNITASKKSGWKYSKDAGETWSFDWNNRPVDLGLELRDGSFINMVGNNSIKEENLKVKPIAGFKKRSNSQSRMFYNDHEIPDEFKTVTVNKKKKGSLALEKKKVLLDNSKHEVLRYTLNGVLVNQTWGAIRQLKGGDLLKVLYPVYTKSNKTSAVGFYRSDSEGENWELESIISLDKILDVDTQDGFSEPDFEVLANNTIVCAMRSSSGYNVAPLYMSTSTDEAKSWSKPEIIAKNGVLPQLKQLKNGVLVLSSGRPGVQLRFSADNGNSWTDAFDFVPFRGIKGQVSCGYTGILELSSNSFLIVYSDFRHRNSKNEIRKAIKVRKVTVNKI